MNATISNCLKGPALLAKAGITLADAQWLYRQARGRADVDSGRLETIHRKVRTFLSSA
jgi:hypothetical protein